MKSTDYDRARKILYKAADIIRQDFSATDAEMIHLLEELQMRFAGKSFENVSDRNLPEDPWRGAHG